MVDSLKDSKSSKMNSQMAGNGGTAEGGNGNENKRDSKEIVFVGYYSCTEKDALNKKECNEWGGYSVDTKCQEGELTDDPYQRSVKINCHRLHVINTNGLGRQLSGENINSDTHLDDNKESSGHVLPPGSVQKENRDREHDREKKSAEERIKVQEEHKEAGQKGDGRSEMELKVSGTESDSIRNSVLVVIPSDKEITLQGIMAGAEIPALPLTMNITRLVVTKEKKHNSEELVIPTGKESTDTNIGQTEKSVEDEATQNKMKRSDTKTHTYAQSKKGSDIEQDDAHQHEKDAAKDNTSTTDQERTDGGQLANTGGFNIEQYVDSGNSEEDWQYIKKSTEKKSKKRKSKGSSNSDDGASKKLQKKFTTNIADQTLKPTDGKCKVSDNETRIYRRMK
jgi:hypothetical protein